MTAKCNLEILGTLERIYNAQIVFFCTSACLFLGKTKESICQKLDEIIAKQKFLENTNKANNTSPNHEKRAPKHSNQNVKIKHKKMSTSGKAEHLSTSKQEHLRFRKRRTVNIRTNPTAKPSHSGSPHNSLPTSQRRKHPIHIPVRLKRLRPNLLSHNRSKNLAQDQG